MDDRAAKRRVPDRVAHSDRLQSTNPVHADRRRIKNPSLLALLILVIVLVFLLLCHSFSQATLTQAQTSTSFPPAGQWYTYANGDDILALGMEGDVLWAGTRAGGVIRWNTADGSFVQFLKPQDGLAGNVVYDIAIDAHGHKWFATDHGLSVLDDNGTPGKSDDTWHSYTRENTAGQLPSDHITAVAMDEAGHVWVGAWQYWDPNTETYTGGGLTELDPGGTLDPADDVWLHTYTFDSTLTVQQGQQVLGLASDNILDILPVPNNRVWVATAQHWLFEEPGGNIPGRWVQMHGGLSRLDHAGTPAADDDVWKTWNCEDDSQFACVVTQLRMDSRGYVWAAMRGRGVLTFRHDASTLRPDRDRFTTADGLESNFVDAIAFGPPDDPEWQNTVWFSTYRSINGRGYGVSVLDHGGTPGNRSDDTWNAKNPVSGEPITTANGLAGDRVRAMVAGPDVVWMGTSGINGAASGISPFDLTKRAVGDALTTAGTTPASNYITDLAFGQPGSRWENQVWVATGHRRDRRYGVGALRLDTRGTLDPGDDTWSQYTRENTDDDHQPPWTGLASNNVVAVAVDGDRVWFGTQEATWSASQRRYTDGGLSVFDGVSWTVRTVDNTGGDSAGLRSNRISALAVGCHREVWVGLGSLQNTFGDGINVLEPGEDPHDREADTWWDVVNYPTIPSNLITSIVPDCEHNRLWVSGVPHYTDAGHRGGGLGAYDYTTGTWTTYTATTGLQSFTNRDTTGEAQSVAVGPDGTVWAGTWGTSATSRSDVIRDWPYVPAVVNWYRDGRWTNVVFDRAGWISSIAVDEDGMVWAGTSRGGMDLDRDGQPEDLEVGKDVGGLKLTQDGTAWTSWLPANSDLVSDDIEAIAISPDGDVWIGTSGWGLMRFHPGMPAQPTPTPTETSVPPSTTATPTPTPTLTRTMTPAATATSPPSTPTPTPAGGLPNHVYLPLLMNNRVR